MARRHDALVPLSHDHQKALSLAFRLLHPAPPGPVTPTTPASTPASRRAETLEFFAAHLAGHFAIEEELLFPALRAASPADSPMPALLDSLLDDHAEFHRLRDALEVARGDDETAELLTTFAELLSSHVRREERELFTGFPDGLTEDAVASLQRAIHARRPPDQRRPR